MGLFLKTMGLFLKMMRTMAATPTVAMNVTAPSLAPLVAAVKNGDAAAVRLLLKEPNSVNVVEPDGTTALHVATDRSLLTSNIAEQPEAPENAEQESKNIEGAGIGVLVNFQSRG